MKRTFLLCILLLLSSTHYSYADGLQKICIRKEIDDDNAIAQINGEEFLIKKWTLAYSPYRFEHECFPSKISFNSIEIFFEDHDTIKWDIVDKVSSRIEGVDYGSRSNQWADCRETMIREPSPFNANGGEIIKLLDGTIWKEQSYKYLYLYEYHPTIYICPSNHKMIVKDKILDVVRVR